MMLITHDLGVIAQMAEQVVVMAPDELEQGRHRGKCYGIPAIPTRGVDRLPDEAAHEKRAKDLFPR